MSPDAGLTFWVIYDHPADYPSYYVVRAQTALADGTRHVAPSVSVHDTLDDARRAIPAGLICMPHQPDEDPVILETWF
jgi:hypothetical protein